MVPLAALPFHCLGKRSQALSVGAPEQERVGGKPRGHLPEGRVLYLPELIMMKATLYPCPFENVRTKMPCFY